MPKQLWLMVFIHEDLSDYPYRDLRDQFDWLISEIEDISGRQMTLTFVPSSNSPELSSYDYKNSDAASALWGWYDKIEAYKASSTFKFDDNLHKFLLLTRDNINSGVAGIAAPTGHYAIASINHRAPAHEVGHMFDARHDDYEVLYNGWWDETIMAPGSGFSSLRGNANRFSDKNRDNIREYLEQFD
ncbi:hypothetical protein [Pseudomonas sp. PD9R]|uniref:hypothetical protein n=1 Tax=Pseudomonas sp. PD9R TaxID=2853534 RepID=UPI001C451DFE|nr:hypothetical protein [Pseudomonas sp. PD9R]MBV6825343.1 hypothetical protein [Pseudomonas sp. PD9R]